MKIHSDKLVEEAYDFAANASMEDDSAKDDFSVWLGAIKVYNECQSSSAAVCSRAAMFYIRKRILGLEYDPQL